MGAWWQSAILGTELTGITISRGATNGLCAAVSDPRLRDPDRSIVGELRHHPAGRCGFPLAPFMA
jgi:hypothetical protein